MTYRIYRALLEEPSIWGVEPPAARIELVLLLVAALIAGMRFYTLFLVVPAWFLHQALSRLRDTDELYLRCLLDSWRLNAYYPAQAQ